MEEAQRLNNQGVALKQEGCLSEALESFQKALDGFRESKAPATILATANFNVGCAQSELGQCDEAIRSYLQDVYWYTKAGKTESSNSASALLSGQADVWHNMGELHFRQGKYERAVGDYRSAVRLRNERLLLSDIKRLKMENAGTLQSLGGTYLKLHQEENTLECGHQALQMIQELDTAATEEGEDNLDMKEVMLIKASILSHNGQALTHLKRFDEALTALNEALKIRTTQLGEEHRLVADTLFDIGKAHFNYSISDGTSDTDQERNECLQAWNRALTIRRQVAADSKTPLAKILFFLGWAYSGQSHAAVSAITCLQEARALYLSIVTDSDSSINNDVAEAQNHLGIIATILRNLEDTENIPSSQT